MDARPTLVACARPSLVQVTVFSISAFLPLKQHHLSNRLLLHFILFLPSAAIPSRKLFFSPSAEIGVERGPRRRRPLSSTSSHRHFSFYLRVDCKVGRAPDLQRRDHPLGSQRWTLNILNTNLCRDHRSSRPRTTRGPLLRLASMAQHPPCTTVDRNPSTIVWADERTRRRALLPTAIRHTPTPTRNRCRRCRSRRCGTMPPTGSTRSRRAADR